MGAHHQNGVAERAIQTITNVARANMLHATLHCPDKTFIDLWPLAMSYGVWVYNKLPQHGAGLSPEGLFSGVKPPAPVFPVLMSLGVPCMCLTLVFKMERRFRSGKVELGKEYLLVSLPGIPAWFLLSSIHEHNISHHNIMSLLRTRSPPSPL
eukprot:CCRYP_003742-RA/>CCRYP_003742-RA protein AED:0.43 eAED:0.73 QI:0/-1/0/1/-1/0/1/0/152